MLIRNAAVIVALGAGVLAEFAEDVFWIVSHGPLTATRLDPIMSPGDVSSHVHAIIGGSNFGPTYDYANSQKSQCTTANVGNDHSNYWIPQMYNVNDNGSVSLAGLSYANTYYQMRRMDDEPVYEFPPGFRMLAGDPNRRTFDESDPAQDAVRYVCLGSNIPEGHEFPKGQCKDGMRAQIYFPHCWDGINNWLAGSKHVAYGEGRFDGGGKCPATHPKRIMGLFYEFIFHDHAAYHPGKRVWSNGDNVGYSLHADFTNGWPTGFFSEIFSYGRQCSVGFDLKSCPAIAPHVVEGQNCQYKGVKVVEDIGDRGAIPKLPGNNPPVAGYKESAKFNVGSPAPAPVASIRASGIIMGTVKGDSPQSAPPDAISQSGGISSRSAVATTSRIASSSSASRAASTAPSASKTSSSSSKAMASAKPGSASTVKPAASASRSASKSSSTKPKTSSTTSKVSSKTSRTSSSHSRTSTSAKSTSRSAGGAAKSGSSVLGGGAVLIGDSNPSDAAGASASATASDGVSSPVTSEPVSVSAPNGKPLMNGEATLSLPVSASASSAKPTRHAKACGRKGRKRPHRSAA